MSITNSIVSEMQIEDITILDNFNARQHDGAIEDLAKSIRLAGLLIPLIVNERGELLAGHRRLQAARLAGLTTIPVTVQEGDGHSAIGTGIHAIENIARQQLTPAEEATAIQRMLDHGYTPDGAGEVLAMPLARVTRRLTLLQLPDEIRALWGPGDEAGASVTAAPIAADVLRKIPALAEPMLQGHRLTVRGTKTVRREPVDLHIDRLAREPQQYLYHLNAACTDDWKRVEEMPAWPENVILCSAPQQIGGNTLQELKIDGKIRARHTRLTREANDVYVYNLNLQITPDDMDAARAAGVTLTLPSSDGEDATELIFDREWLTARIADEIFPRWEKQILTRIKRKQTEIAKAEKSAGVGGETGKGGTQLTDSELREKRVRTIEREAAKRWKAAAEPANLDLGRVLLDRLSDVEVTADIARLFAIQSLGPRPPKTKPTYDTGERRNAATLAAAGLRYVMPGWQTQQPKPTKAEPDRTVTTYLDQDEAEKKLWQWFDLAKTPGEIFGRALIIHAAARWANEIVVPQAGRKMSSSMGWVTGRTKLTPESYALMEKTVRGQKALPASVKKLIKEMTSFDAGKLEAAERAETAPEAPAPDAPPEGAVSA